MQPDFHHGLLGLSLAGWLFQRGGVREWIPIGIVDRGDEILDRRLGWVVGDDRFLILERDFRARDPFNRQQCGPHRGKTAGSSHPSDFERDGRGAPLASLLGCNGGSRRP
jgi:hypothetical protein